MSIEQDLPKLIDSTLKGALGSAVGPFGYGLTDGSPPEDPLPRINWEVLPATEDVNTPQGTGLIFPVAFQCWNANSDRAAEAIGQICVVLHSKALNQHSGGTLALPAPNELSAIRFRSGGNVTKVARGVFMGELILAFETWRART